MYYETMKLDERHFSENQKVSLENLQFAVLLLLIHTKKKLFTHSQKKEQEIPFS